MVERYSQKISEALVRLGIKKTKLSEVLAISRPTLDKYIDVYDSGDRSTLPKRIHQSFLHISGFLEPENVDGYMSWLRNQYVIHDRRHCRPVCPVVVVDGLTSPADVFPPILQRRGVPRIELQAELQGYGVPDQGPHGLSMR